MIAAASGAARLAGVVAAHTPLPVIGLPVPTDEFGGLNSFISSLQMPGDVPVASVAVGMGARETQACSPFKFSARPMSLCERNLPTSLPALPK